MNPIKVFWMEDTGQSYLYLRRYVSGSGSDNCPHPGNHGFHQAKHFIDIRTLEYDAEHKVYRLPGWDPDDPRWPRYCGCGLEFGPRDAKQLHTRHAYRRTDTGEITTSEDAPPGAMWDNPWYAEVSGRTGPDGRYLLVKTPDGHDWAVDDRASNCDMPKDDAHRCWVRHGDPTRGRVHVDKNGLTCHAGAGSIQTRNWHGFLDWGYLVTNRRAGPPPDWNK